MNRLKLENYLELCKMMKSDLNPNDSFDWYTNYSNAYFIGTSSSLLIRDNTSDIMQSVTLAVIELNHRHQGYGTKIINWLESYGRNHQAKKIIIESILTPEMRNLALKLGFSEIPGNQGTYQKFI